jgi:hypothetical protein
MAERIERFEILTPAGTTKAAPLTSALNFDLGIVDRMEVLVPPGPRGFAGFKIAHSGQVIIPRSGTSWIISDNFTHDWVLDSYPVGQKWSVITHNTDVYDHTIYITIHVNETVRSTTQQIALQPITPFGIAGNH